MRNDSKRAQEFAKEIEASIEGLGNIDLPSRTQRRTSSVDANYDILGGLHVN